MKNEFDLDETYDEDCCKCKAMLENPPVIGWWICDRHGQTDTVLGKMRHVVFKRKYPSVD